MGYYEARIEEARFRLPAELQRPALERLLAVSRDEFGYDLADRGLEDVDGFLRLFGFRTEREDGSIVGLHFEDRFLLETEDVFHALAPFVEAGSDVLIHSGTGARWRYVFDGERMQRRDEPDAPWYGS